MVGWLSHKVEKRPSQRTGWLSYKVAKHPTIQEQRTTVLKTGVCWIITVWEDDGSGLKREFVVLSEKKLADYKKACAKRIQVKETIYYI